MVDPKPTRGLSCFGYAVIGFVLLFILAALLLPAIQAPRTPSMRNICNGHLRQLVVALENDHEAHGHFPPACTYDENGTPLHSWRTLLLPYLEETPAYLKLDLKQPWNSPHNWAILEKIEPYLFHCPSGGGDPSDTTYLAVVGPDGAWDAKNGRSTKAIPDGPEQTILIVEVQDSGIHWAEPRDLPWEQAIQGVNPPHVKFAISSGHRDGAYVAFADGDVEFLQNSTSLEHVRGLLTPAGGENVEIPE
jgi:hypothetical protein